MNIYGFFCCCVFNLTSRNILVQWTLFCVFKTELYNVPEHHTHFEQTNNACLESSNSNDTKSEGCSLSPPPSPTLNPALQIYLLCFSVTKVAASCTQVDVFSVHIKGTRYPVYSHAGQGVSVLLKWLKSQERLWHYSLVFSHLHIIGRMNSPRQHTESALD